MKTLFLITSLFIGITLFIKADDIETLTLNNEVYRATVKTNDVVFYNIIGKSAMTRTNLSGWISLKTTLLNQGYTFSSKTNKIYSAAKPLRQTEAITKNWEDLEKNYTPTPTTYVADTIPRKPYKDYESVSYTKNGVDYTDSIYKSPDGYVSKTRTVSYTDRNGNFRYETYDVP